jgi:hypothetical protein
MYCVGEQPRKFQIQPNRAKSTKTRPKKIKGKGLDCLVKRYSFLPQFQRVKLNTVSFADPCRNAVATLIIRSASPRFRAAGVHSRMGFARSPKRSRASSTPKCFFAERSTSTPAVCFAPIADIRRQFGEGSNSTLCCLQDRRSERPESARKRSRVEGAGCAKIDCSGSEITNTFVRPEAGARARGVRRSFGLGIRKAKNAIPFARIGRGAGRAGFTEARGPGRWQCARLAFLAEPRAATG